MDLRRIGKTDLKVSAIGLGCWQFSQGKGIAGKFWPVLESATMDEIVKAAHEGGITWFDTAEIYGLGNSEKALAAALQRAGLKPGTVGIATKWFPFLRTAKSINATFPQREQALAPYPIDLLQIHQASSLSSVEKQARALAALLKSHKVKAVGVSNFSAHQMRTVAKVLSDEGLILASNQVRYSLAHRRIESDGTLEAAKELGISIIAYSPLAQGLLTGRFHDDPSLLKAVTMMRRANSGLNAAGLKKSAPLVAALREIAKALGVSAAQVAVNWIINANGETVLAIPGATKPRQAVEAAAAMKFTLGPDELNRLEELSAIYK